MSETPVENPEAGGDGKFREWVILELMGHRRLTGYLTEQEIAGKAFLRIEIPSDPPATQYYSPDSAYAITPTTEDLARKAAALSQIAPVHHWELPPTPAASAWNADEEEDDADDGDRDPL